MKFTKRLKLVVSTGCVAAIIGIFSGLNGYAQVQPETPPAGEQEAPQGQPPVVKEDFSDETLEKFVDINIKLAPHQQEGEMKMVKVIEDEGMQADRFSEIMNARQMNDTTNAGASAEELKKVDAAAQKIMGIQQELQQKMTKVIADEGMQPQEFQEIILAYQQSPKVQEKVNAIVQEQQKEQPDSGQVQPAEPAPEQ